MTTLLLIRHGENEFTATGRLAGRLPGVHLNERGRRQAVALAGVLGNAPIQAIYSSPLERALESAAPLAAVLGLEVQIEAGLIEVEIGNWTGRPLKALRKLKAWKTLQETPSRFGFPGGESYLEMQARSVAAVESIAEKHPEGLVACFSHGDIIRVLAAYFLNVPLDSFQRLNIDTTSITQVNLGKDGRVFVPYVNQVLNFAWPVKKEEKSAPQRRRGRGAAQRE
ncbi:MAG: histidine phosphatase family protein [Anaerolineaceae bacterium]|nr:histidine phosphatase family protein [Anaerolineaceae bacterium]